MNLQPLVVGALFGVLTTGCLKDGIDAVDQRGSRVDVRFDLHCNGRPFSPDSVYADGFGTPVRITLLRFALLNPAMLGDQGQDMGSWPSSLLMADSPYAGRGIPLGEPRTGEIHWVDVRLCDSTDTSDPALHALHVDQPGGFLAVLDLQGVYDSNGNGDIDEADAPFRIAVPSDGPIGLRVHAHCQVFADSPADLRVPVNVIALLKDIDLPDQPVTIGHGPYATQALANLRNRVLGLDHEPI